MGSPISLFFASDTGEHPRQESKDHALQRAEHYETCDNIHGDVCRSGHDSPRFAKSEIGGHDDSDHDHLSLKHRKHKNSRTHPIRGGFKTRREPSSHIEV